MNGEFYSNLRNAIILIFNNVSISQQYWTSENDKIENFNISFIFPTGS